MQVQRYFAPDMREALRLVHEELGPEAMIISNRKVPGGVEIVTALDYDDAMRAYEIEREEARPARRRQAPEQESGILPEWIRRDFEAEQAQAKEEYVRAPSDVPQRDRQLAGLRRQLPDTSAQDEITAMRAELESLRRMLASQGRSSPAATPSPVARPTAPTQQERLRSRCQQLGLTGAVAGRLVQAVPEGLPLDKAWQQCVARLAKELPLSAEKELIDRNGVFVLLGPTGAGKTTTLAKLAARYVIKYGPETLALVSTDSFRVGSFEQLQKIGSALGVDVRLVEGEQSLDDVLKGLGPRRLVLVDTAGFSRHAPEQEAQRQLLARSRYRLHCQLVLPTTAQAAVLTRTAEDFQAFSLKGAILSKLDETTSLGEALSVLIETSLPVAYVTNGQRIPEDLAVPRAAQLVSQAVAMASHRISRDESSSGRQDSVSLATRPRARPTPSGVRRATSGLAE